MTTVLVTASNSMQNFAISAVVLVITTASTQYAYAQSDGQTMMTWVAWLNTQMVYHIHGQWSPI